MTRPADSAYPPARGPALRLWNALGGIGFACLTVITLASPGATRMYAWPWSLAYAGSLLAPALMLILRGFDTHRPLALPAPVWRLTALACALVVLASALASPYRGPSLLWSAPLLAGLAFFFVAFDAAHAGAGPTVPMARLGGIFLVAIVVASLALWLPGISGRSFSYVANSRNPYPLGHSNYTAGLALLALPWLTTLAWRARGLSRGAWGTGSALALLMLFTTGSRGGLIGLVALAIATLILAPLDRRKKYGLAVGFAAMGLVLAIAHPRTRAMFAPPDPLAAPNLSNVERTAWLVGAWHMGLDRPLLGWGPGTTPLAFPRYRAALDGGTEDVLQLHCAPAQLWAEFGGIGVAGALMLVLLILRHAQPHPVATATLVGYFVFSFTDWQFDVPVFAFAVALSAALVAPPAEKASPVFGPALGGVTLLAVGLIALLGRPDPAPELNVRALVLARNPAQADRAITVLGESLSFNPDQEIAHFNLGWLLLTRDPAAAERHFLAAAHLVPDKGGVYFGLGLARLNQGHRGAAARALALECLNDPAFLNSPWWREPAVAALRDPAAADLAPLIADAKLRLTANTWAATQLARVSALAPLLGAVSPGEEKSYRRERIGYPVLMRNLDLPTPVDLFDVRESVTPVDSNVPPKGWLPSPILLALLDAPSPSESKSEIGNRK